MQKNQIYGSINWDSFQSKLFNLKESKDIDGKWETHRPKVSPLSLLNKIISEGEINKSFDDIKPKTFGYMKLEKELAKYRDYQKKG